MGLEVLEAMRSQEQSAEYGHSKIASEESGLHTAK